MGSTESIKHILTDSRQKNTDCSLQIFKAGLEAFRSNCGLFRDDVALKVSTHGFPILAGTLFKQENCSFRDILACSQALSDLIGTHEQESRPRFDSYHNPINWVLNPVRALYAAFRQRIGWHDRALLSKTFRFKTQIYPVKALFPQNKHQNVAQCVSAFKQEVDKLAVQLESTRLKAVELDTCPSKMAQLSGFSSWQNVVDSVALEADDARKMIDNMVYVAYIRGTFVQSNTMPCTKQSMETTSKHQGLEEHKTQLKIALIVGKIKCQEKFSETRKRIKEVKDSRWTDDGNDQKLKEFLEMTSAAHQALFQAAVDRLAEFKMDLSKAIKHLEAFLQDIEYIQSILNMLAAKVFSKQFSADQLIPLLEALMIGATSQAEEAQTFSANIEALHDKLINGLKMSQADRTAFNLVSLLIGALAAQQACQGQERLRSIDGQSPVIKRERWCAHSLPGNSLSNVNHCSRQRVTMDKIRGSLVGLVGLFGRSSIKKAGAAKNSSCSTQGDFHCNTH